MSIQWTAHTAVADKFLDRGRWLCLADGLAIALAVSLPWSTSATGIIAALWLLVLIPVLDRAALRRVLTTPAGALPVLLWALGVAGMLWADAPWDERFKGLGALHKLLCIPLLMAQFDRSDRAPWLMTGFVGSCCALLALSFALALFPEVPWWDTVIRGVPVKNYAAQSELFTVCVFLLAALAYERWQQANRAAGLAMVALSLAFLANIQFIATTRTALAVLPLLALLFGFRCARWRGLALAFAATIAIGALAWTASPFLQERVGSFSTEVKNYRDLNQRSSAGERLEFWKKSTAFIWQVPVFGHGTGTISEQFRRAAVGNSGAASVVSANPHNQTLAVAIQFGLVGVAVLLVMWASHLMLFRGRALAAWIGLVVVVQNVVGSLFNSQLFDFTHGWAYVIGVGVCGGAMLARGGATLPK